MTTVFNCSCCGKVVHDLSQYVETRYGHFMVENHFCYCCSYWNVLVAEPNVFICEKGIVYREFASMDDPLDLCEDGVIRYMTLGDNAMHQTRNLWPIARVPEMLRPMLKANIKILLNNFRVAA